MAHLGYAAVVLHIIITRLTCTHRILSCHLHPIWMLQPEWWQLPAIFDTRQTQVMTRASRMLPSGHVVDQHPAFDPWR